MTFPELLALDIYTYRVILVNAFVNEARKTEKGNEMLNRYARISAVDQDMDTSGLENLIIERSKGSFS